MPKTLSDIIPPSRRRAMEADMGPTESYEPPPKRKKSRRFPYGFVIAVVAVLVACFALLMLFSGATISITPTVNQTTVSGEWSATPSAGELPFEVVSVDQVVTDEIQAEGTETANVSAQGTITIYNAQDKVQELIKNTRFESPDGKIFRIQESITVPAGSESAPGTRQATVYADATGDSYNIGATTFTLPGLKGSALFDLVYAKSDAPMVGGFSGTRPSVNQATRQSAYEKMQPQLESQLADLVKERIPEGYVLLPGSAVTTYTELPDQAGTSSTVNVQLRGTTNAFIFPNEALARAIAYRTVASYNGQPLELVNGDALTLTPAGEEPPTPGMQNFSFSLSGEAVLVWKVNSEEIIEAVTGKTRDASKTLLKSFPEVGEGNIVLRPFWEGRLPEDPAKIEVKVGKPDLDR